MTKKISRLQKKITGMALASSLFLASSGCSFFPKIPETFRTCNIVIPKNYGKEPVNLQTEDGSNVLFDFPDKIPGASRIDKYLTPGSRYCLVHVRQAHFIDSFSERNIENIKDENLRKKVQEKRENVIKVQQNIYKVLEYLMDNFLVSQVYSEGVSPNLEKLEDQTASQSFKFRKDRREFKEEVEKNINHLEKRLNDKDSYIIFNEAEKKEYEEFLSGEINLKKQKLEQLEELERRVEKLDQEQMIHGAHFLLACHKGLKVLAAENSETSLMAVLRIQKAEKSKDQPKAVRERAYLEALISTMDERENWALKMVSGQYDSLGVLIFGGLHAFGGDYSFGKNYLLGRRISLQDNISFWNSKNPDRKFSLIEITPENYEPWDNQKKLLKKN